MIEYGLIGKHLGHSFSARYFNEKFGRENIPSHYDLFEIPEIEYIIPLIKNLPELRGLNVTIPYKQEVIQYLDALSPEAEEIGAVNTIRIERQFGKIRLIGHNTDSIGFREAIRPLLKGRRNALVLGSGGASKAIFYALRKLGVNATGVSRRKDSGSLLYSELTEEVMSETDIIVNCTPLGMWPGTESCPDIPYRFVNERYLCFDLVYNPEETKFMRRCAEQGAEVVNGLGMLYGQAEAAYKFWNTAEYHLPESTDGKRPSTEKGIMSRRIEIHAFDHVTTYYRAIAKVRTDIDHKIIRIHISPFEEEIPAVEYIDHPVILKLGGNLK